VQWIYEITKHGGVDIQRSGKKLLLYNMHHIQEHASQLSLMLEKKPGSVSDWIIKAGK
jgi:macrodomain Ter protein organizer (MatP/YcbG family)